MNLNSVVNGVTIAINPNIAGTFYASSGQTTNPDGSQTPTFAAGVTLPMQVQALSGGNLRHLDALNIQGIMRAVYMFGLAEGVDRPAAKGGDVLVFADLSGAFTGQYWVVTNVLEPWSESAGWTKVAVTLQNGKPAGIP